MNNWQALLSPDIKAFIRDNDNTDIRTLALKKPPSPDWPYTLILDQIKARQKAKTKIPQWLDNHDIILPTSDTLEQASSAACALYKASLFKGIHLCDLTGGAGIDSWALLKNHTTATIIDANTNTAEILQHNLNVLSDKPTSILSSTAEKYVQSMQACDLALIDPQRRTQNRKGLYKLEDCSPNIFELLPNIKANTIVLKTSPMLDISKAIDQLKYVHHVHVVEWQGECKELLFIMKPNETYDTPDITAVKIDETGTPVNTLTFNYDEENKAQLNLSKPLQYLYEPSPAFMKAGGYQSISNTYTLPKLAPHTHLYTSEHAINDFPGRSFEILNTYPPKTKSLPFTKANLTIRNYPQDMQTLKKKLKLKDGGDDYLFACTISDSTNTKNSHVILHCRKKKDVN